MERLYILLIFIVAVIFVYFVYKNSKSNETKYLNEIEKKSADLEKFLITELYENKNTEEVKSRSSEIEKVLIDAAKLKFELVQKYNLEIIKTFLTLGTIIITVLALGNNYLSYMESAEQNRQDRLNTNFIDLSQRIAEDNEDVKITAITAFPMFTLPKKKIKNNHHSLNRTYNNYDDYLIDFRKKYPYSLESISIILNVLEKEAIDSAKIRCGVSSECSNIDELYDYLKAPFLGTIFLNELVNTLNQLTQNTRENVSLKESYDLSTAYEWKNISAVDLRNKFLRGAYLRNADFRGVNAKFAMLCFANLSGAKFSDSNFSGATLVDTNLRFAKLQNSYLLGVLAKGADFTGANLENANFKYAVLINANLRFSYMNGTNFEKAILYKAKFNKMPYDSEQFKGLSLDSLIKNGATKEFSAADYSDVRLNKILPNFERAVIDYNNYNSLDFLNRNYHFILLKESEIMHLESGAYGIKIHLVNELKKGNKIGILKTIKNINNRT